MAPPTGKVPASDAKTRPNRKSWTRPAATGYSVVRQSPSHGLAAAVSAIDPVAEHAGLSNGTPSVFASCGHSWCSSNSQYGHECVPDGRYTTCAGIPILLSLVANACEVSRDRISRPMPA
jgi:hypothetical protein